jgi:hypothetical protein
MITRYRLLADIMIDEMCIMRMNIFRWDVIQNLSVFKWDSLDEMEESTKWTHVLSARLLRI